MEAFFLGYGHDKKKLNFVGVEGCSASVGVVAAVPPFAWGVAPWMDHGPWAMDYGFIMDRYHGLPMVQGHGRTVEGHS